MYLVFYKYGEENKSYLLGAYETYKQAREQAIVSAYFKPVSATSKIIPVEIDIESADNPWKNLEELVWERDE